MQKNLIPEGDYLTVIRRAEVLPWGTMPHRAPGLTLEICGGPQSGGGLFRWIFFDAFQPERARELFGRLGGRLSRVEEIDRDAPGLVCNLLRVRVIHDAQGRVKPLILGFAGREICEQLKIGR